MRLAIFTMRRIIRISLKEFVYFGDVSKIESEIDQLDEGCPELYHPENSLLKKKNYLEVSRDVRGKCLSKGWQL